jgi:cell pole-organizing protein PopZ
MRHVGEPSVEEILESIKKVIARDNRAEAAQQRIRRESHMPASLYPERAERSGRPFDVLELTEAETSDLPPLAAHSDHDAYDIADDDDEAAEDAMSAERERPLMPESATASMRDSLAALAMLSGPGASPQIVRSGETSLEGLTRELLRPMLAEWLEKNLPGMVEKLVAAEIARIAGKRG